MTPEAQQKGIAEACGWTNVAPRIVKNVKHQGDDITVGIWSDNGWIPDYLNDLNAMHEAVNSLTTSQMTTMSQHLHRRLGMLWGFATAAQFAEAFLRTIGKWQEAKP